MTGSQPHLVAEQSLFRVCDQVVQHVLHTAPAAEIDQALDRVELIQACPDQEHHEVAVYLG